ncbi:histone deacetylase 7 isoform X2 [Bombina bombina]|uniref:histone deacetylase 7 isoform X2 n=1 Tax=Bombina bombina TaxID=8345 RepID=UPI00235A871D|nr:histone deacetylase 7 isoform X2 [Bombina bombina]
MPGLHQMLNTIYEADSASSADGIRRGNPGLRYGQKSGAAGPVDLSIPVSTITTQTTHMDFHLVQRFGQRSDTALLTPKQSQQTLFQAISQHQQAEPKIRSLDSPCRNTDHGRQQLNKERPKCAMASPAVKQKLLEKILNKQQIAPDRNNMANHISPVIAYRPPEHIKQEPPQPTVLTNLIHQVAAASGNQPEHYPLRKTVSEPNLKWPGRFKKSGRKNPLTRKESAPPAVRRRPPETQDSSPSSSSTPVSGCSSPNDSIAAENGSLSSIPGATSEGEMERRTLQSLVHRVPLLTTHPTVFMQSGIEGHDGTNSLATTRLQPVIILESSGAHTPMVAVHSIAGPMQFTHSIISPDHLSATRHHKPLSRTRSEPLPQNQKTLHQQLLYQHQYPLFPEHMKHRQLAKRVVKTSEKPRLHQIPSEEMDESGSACERPTEMGSNAARGCVEVIRGGQSDAPSNNYSVMQPQHSFMQQAYLWDQSHHRTHQQLKRPLETLMIPIQQGGHRPLTRAKSSPASASLPTPDPSTKTVSLPVPEQASKSHFTTGVVYDSVMLKHQCTCGDNSNHPEHAGRIQSIWSRLQERGLRNNCECIRGRKATLEELQSVHSETHVLRYGTNPLNRLKLDDHKLAGILSQRRFVMLSCGGLGVDSDTIWNELHSSNAARWAAGSVIELAFKVATRELKNGFALVRPPGHHADPTNAMGFCFFNSVAIAAKQLQQRLDVRKILIVDWDVHHGNGTQQIFYKDPNVLYISLHRHDDGNFFPGSGAADEVGAGAGEGFNVNVAWTGGLDPPMGDAEYLAAFRTVVMPVAHEFSPDVVLVSAGFDAAEGHPAPLGGYKVTAKCFGHMTRQLMNLAEGRVVLALEGGHDLTSICDASEACVSVLLGNELDPVPEETLRQRPNPNALRSLETVIQVQSKYWTSVKRFASKVGYSLLEAQKHDIDEVETVTALASLSVGMGTMSAAGSRPQDEPMEEDDDMSL